MTCSQWEESLIEAGRGSTPDAATAAHLRQCPRCGVFLHRQSALTKGLAALAASETREPSVALERALLRKMKHGRGGPRKKWVALAGSAAAAALVFACWPAPKAPLASEVLQPVAVAAPAPSTALPPTLHLASRKHARRRVARAAPDEFVGIPYSAPLDPHERVELLRVDMPVEAFAAWGLPVTGVGPGLRVNADLVLGEDGLARAVRLVQFQVEKRRNK